MPPPLFFFHAADATMFAAARDADFAISCLERHYADVTLTMQAPPRCHTH